LFQSIGAFLNLGATDIRRACAVIYSVHLAVVPVPLTAGGVIQPRQYSVAANNALSHQFIENKSR